MAQNLDRNIFLRTSIGNTFPGSGARSNTSLNAAFVNATSGPAVAVRYMAQSTDTIDEFYIFLDTITGTRGNITMEAQIFNEQAAQLSRAGTTSRDTSTATAMPAGDDQWIKFTFGTPYTPSVGEILWIVAYNTAAAPGTDYPQILIGTNTVCGPNVLGTDTMHGYVTTTGFTTNATGIPEIPFIVKQGSSYFGQPFTQRLTLYSNNTLERGIQITPDEDVLVSGIVFDVNSAASDFRILADGTAPGGGAIHTFDLNSDTNETINGYCGAKIFDTPITLYAGVTYKATFLHSGNNTLPTVVQIEDYSSYSSMFDTFRAYDTMRMPWSVIDDGAGGWTINKSICPSMFLIVQRHPLIDTPSVGNVHDDDTVRGAAGTLTLPAEAEVELGVQYGAGGTEFTGTLVAGGGGGGPVMGGMVVR